MKFNLILLYNIKKIKYKNINYKNVYIIKYILILYIKKKIKINLFN